MAHGGGRRCNHPECTKSAAGKTEKCVAHGGGKRCVEIGCDKSGVGASQRCKGHGGGRRCAAPDCTKSAQGGSSTCKAHGGGKQAGVGTKRVLEGAVWPTAVPTGTAGLEGGHVVLAMPEGGVGGGNPSKRSRPEDSGDPMQDPMQPAVGGGGEMQQAMPGLPLGLGMDRLLHQMGAGMMPHGEALGSGAVHDID